MTTGKMAILKKMINFIMVIVALVVLVPMFLVLVLLALMDLMRRDLKTGRHDSRR